MRRVVVPCAALCLAALAACSPPRLPLREFIVTDHDPASARPADALVLSATGFQPANASPERRVETARRVWQTIVDRYYDPDFDGRDIAALRARSVADARAATSDLAFYRALQRDVDALGDSHTEILTPREAESERIHRAVRIGMRVEVIDDRAVVMEVEPDSAAHDAGLRAGTVIESVDGVVLDGSFLDRAAAQVEPAAASARGGNAMRGDVAVRLGAIWDLLLRDADDPGPHRLAVLAPDDARQVVQVRARVDTLGESVSYRLLPSGIGVLRFSSFDDDLKDDLARALDEARAHADGLIIDLRGNPGGDQNLFQWLAGQFLEQPVDAVQVRDRLRRRQAPWLATEPTAVPFRKPLAILTNTWTGSMAELTAHVLVEQRGAIAVGTATCGCVVGIRGDYLLPDGGTLHVAEQGYRTAGGRVMEDDPLQPAVAVATTLADARAGRDAVLRAGEAAILARVSATSAHAGHTTAVP